MTTFQQCNNILPGMHCDIAGSIPAVTPRYCTKITMREEGRTAELLALGKLVKENAR
jgi:hypothetical protein